MNSFEKVIGYDTIKEELLQVCDMIHNREVYEKLGAKIPNGILLSGDPGLGKSLMAKCFIEESGLKSYTIRKNKSDNFAGYISEVFEKAKENVPCIVFLDDMDKFANEDDDHCDADEYVAVQSAIDEVRDIDVFILATVNNIRKLPDSLVRAGRFDRTIFVERPNSSDCTKIIKHYLKKKAVSPDLNISDITKMINYSSCAELETIVNEAAIRAAYDRREFIDIEDFVSTIVRLEYNLSDSCDQTDEKTLKRIAMHEAGHLVMSEVLIPGSIGFASVRKSRSSEKGGFVHRCKDLESREQHILISLAGKAATELYFGSCDVGSETDINRAISVIRDAVSDTGTEGFGMVDVTRRFESASDMMNFRIEAVVQAKLENYMFRVREILIKNREFLEKTAELLAEKENLLSSDIEKIRASVMVSEIAV